MSDPFEPVKLMHKAHIKVVQKHWVIVDHLCRSCGGRILKCVKGGGATPGGNPIFRCADCGAGAAAMGPQDLCWCGFSHRGQHATAYVCLPFSILEQQPYLRDGFLACGCDPRRGEVGVMLEDTYRKLVQENEIPFG